MQLTRRITITAAAAALGLAGLGGGTAAADGHAHVLKVDTETFDHSSVAGPTIHWWTYTPNPTSASHGTIAWDGKNGAGHIGSCEAKGLEFESMHWVLAGGHNLVISGVSCSEPADPDPDNPDPDNPDPDNPDPDNGTENPENAVEDDGDEQQQLTPVPAPAGDAPPATDVAQLPPPGPEVVEVAPEAPTAPPAEPVTTLPATGSGTAVTAAAALAALLGGLALLAASRRRPSDA